MLPKILGLLTATRVLSILGLVCRSLHRSSDNTADGEPLKETTVPSHGTGFPVGAYCPSLARAPALLPQSMGGWASTPHHALCRKYRECWKVRSLPAVHARPACTARSIALQNLRRSVSVHLAAQHDVLVRRVLREVMREAADRRHEHHGRRQALGQDLRVVA